MNSRSQQFKVKISFLESITLLAILGDFTPRFGKTTDSTRWSPHDSQPRQETMIAFNLCQPTIFVILLLESFFAPSALSRAMNRDSRRWFIHGCAWTSTASSIAWLTAVQRSGTAGKLRLYLRKCSNPKLVLAQMKFAKFIRLLTLWWPNFVFITLFVNSNIFCSNYS